MKFHRKILLSSSLMLFLAVSSLSADIDPGAADVFLADAHFSRLMWGGEQTQGPLGGDINGYMRGVCLSPPNGDGKLVNDKEEDDSTREWRETDGLLTDRDAAIEKLATSSQGILQAVSLKVSVEAVYATADGQATVVVLRPIGQVLFGPQPFISANSGIWDMEMVIDPAALQLPATITLYSDPDSDERGDASGFLTVNARLRFTGLGATVPIERPFVVTLDLTGRWDEIFDHELAVGDSNLRLMPAQNPGETCWGWIPDTTGQACNWCNQCKGYWCQACSGDRWCSVWCERDDLVIPN